MSAGSQQQPVVVYPNTVSGQQHNPSHSNGSFGTVFIVLAVIVAISAIACFLGRLCNRRYHKQQRPKVSHKQAQLHKFPDQPKEGDIEFGNQSRIQPETQKFRVRPRDEDMNRGGGLEQMMRNPREGGGIDPTRDPREAGSGMEFGLDKRVPSGRLAGDGGIIRGFNPSENGEVHKFGAYDHA